MDRQPASTVVRLACGVDALYLSGRGALPGELAERLAELKSLAQVRAEASVVLGGEPFEVAPSGLGRYAYRLGHRYGVIGISPGRHLPTFRVQPLSAALHELGPEQAVEWFVDHIEAEGGPVDWSVARLDLYADFQGWSPVAGDRDRFVCRARHVTTHEVGQSLTGFEVGRRGTLTARIYDKTEKVREDGSDWWPLVWGDAYDAGKPVWRVEFEFDREVLSQLAVSDPVDALERVPELWAYASRDWLSLRDPTGDETRSRWPVSQEWLAVQAALLGNETVPAERMAERRRSGTLRTLLPALRGYVAKVAALLGATDLESAMRGLHDLLARDEAESGYPFALRIQLKRREQVGL